MDCSSWNVFRLKNMPSGLKKTLQSTKTESCPTAKIFFFLLLLPMG